MARRDLPGSFEQLVLLAVLRLGERAYGMTVRRELEARTSRSTSLGAVYATLDRMERKGWVRSVARAPDVGSGRGGRARRFFRVDASGREALTEALAEIDAMRTGLGPDASPAGGSA